MDRHWTQYKEYAIEWTRLSLPAFVAEEWLHWRPRLLSAAETLPLRVVSSAQGFMVTASGSGPIVARGLGHGASHEVTLANGAEHAWEPWVACDHVEIRQGAATVCVEVDFDARVRVEEIGPGRLRVTPIYHAADASAAIRVEMWNWLQPRNLEHPPVIRQPLTKAGVLNLPATGQGAVLLVSPQGRRERTIVYWQGKIWRKGHPDLEADIDRLYPASNAAPVWPREIAQRIALLEQHGGAGHDPDFGSSLWISLLRSLASLHGGITAPPTAATPLRALNRRFELWHHAHELLRDAGSWLDVIKPALSLFEAAPGNGTEAALQMAIHQALAKLENKLGEIAPFHRGRLGDWIRQGHIAAAGALTEVAAAIDFVRANGGRDYLWLMADLLGAPASLELAHLPPATITEMAAKLPEKEEKYLAWLETALRSRIANFQSQHLPQWPALSAGGLSGFLHCCGAQTWGADGGATEPHAKATDIVGQDRVKWQAALHDCGLWPQPLGRGRAASA